MVDVGGLLEEHFAKHPYAEFSTTELIKITYPEEYERIKAALHDPITSKESRTVAKRHKAQLHRRLLYHLNRLREEGTITTSQIKNKGEKCYCLARHHPPGRQTPETPNAAPLLQHLEHYEEQGIIAGYDKRGWHNRLNAVLIEAKAEDTTNTLHELLTTTGKHINDVIALHGTEQLLLQEDLTKLTSFIKQLDIDTRDNNKTISLLIDLTKAEQVKYTEDFFDTYALLAPPRINIVLSVTKKFIDNHQRLIKHIIKSFADNNLKVNLHHKDVHDAPIIVGKAGMYTLSEQEWDAYQEEAEDATIGLCVGQVSIGVDVHRFFKHEKSDTAFRTFILKLARTLVESNTLQRRRADITFYELNKLNADPHTFFRFANNYIRLWNYDWQEKDRPHFIELLRTTAEELKELCTTEETIFKSCGIPIRFNTTMSSTFSKFAPGLFSPRKYTKLSVTSTNVLHGEEMQQFITARERICKHFNHNDRIRIFRTTPADPDDVLKEIRYLLTEYAIPHLTYDFAQRRADLTLDRFMEAK
ncbi:hypothetical protein GF367_00375 [Candidatus Woesearchaeota archaeon]|nr:hypothetical protein [Candidatus Woesearchaeota archaeon]